MLTLKYKTISERGNQSKVLLLTQKININYYNDWFVLVSNDRSVYVRNIEILRLSWE